MINAVIFDMDGVLINSEPLWREAEIAVFETIGLQLTDEMCSETTGLRLDEAVKYWLSRHRSTEVSASELEDRIIGEVIKRIQMKATLMMGVDHALSLFRTKGLKIGLASSSAFRIIWTVLEKFNLREQFDFIYSAEEEEFGKPHPGIYLTVGHRLGVNPTECLAIEDSLMGVLAAKSARMKCIAVPESASQRDPRFAIADCVLGSLLEINNEVWSRILSLP